MTFANECDTLLTYFKPKLFGETGKLLKTSTDGHFATYGLSIRNFDFNPAKKAGETVNAE
jgi:hypothetical protein